MNIAFCALHYGSDYLGYSIKSIYDYVDRIYILYSDRPTFSYQTSMINPDTREKLVAAAYMFGDPKSKIRWIDGHWNTEGQHRQAIHHFSAIDNPDCIVTVDADEVWAKRVIENALDKGYKGNSRIYGAKMLTFWRSFSWICLDDWLPVRLTFPKRNGPNDSIDGRVFHFGYARSIADISYKVPIHGHHHEWRPEWFGRFVTWPQSGNNDLHPVAKDVWNAMPYDKAQLPDFMKQHPYYNLDIIA